MIQKKPVTAELKAAGGNVYALAINNGGAIHANTLANEGGHIFLKSVGGTVQNTGTLDASATAPGGHGGTVAVEGERVLLLGHGTVDVSGDAGGGTALIGGDLHGANPNVLNSQYTAVGRDFTIRADAGTRGNGGKVIVWSDRNTVFAGNISAHGGSLGGNGGFAEVSGKQNLAFDGNVDLHAAVGRVGRLLLDPNNITIDNTGTDDAQLNDDTIAVGDGAGTDFSISHTKVETELNNANVVAAAVSISVDNAIDATGNAVTHDLHFNRPYHDLQCRYYSWIGRNGEWNAHAE